ncbi:MAG TPA: methylmalonyl-CoA epimerase [Planctomycetota bacterium]|nr:methylmalonyl-CoA epimerase [Planctomycetota bacterium]
MKIKKIEHLGIGVPSLEEALKLYRDALGFPVADLEVLGDMKLKVIKVQAGDTVLELLEPLPGETVISKFLAERKGGIHHVCFEVDDVMGATMELASKGYEPLWPEPRRGAGNRLVNFLRPKKTGGVLIEFNQAGA